MTATLNMNLNDALSPEELRQLLDASVQEKKPIERILFEAVKELLNSRTHSRSFPDSHTDPSRFDSRKANS